MERLARVTLLLSAAIPVLKKCNFVKLKTLNHSLKSDENYSILSSRNNPYKSKRPKRTVVPMINILYAAILINKMFRIFQQP